ncbi:MAG: molecular chaperone DnaK [Mycobacteriales bacterium]|jgi:molecular chaperone DnaK
MTVLGIDLGNANSVVYALVGGETVLIPAADSGGPVTPSVVAFAAADDALVGDPAGRQAAADPTRVSRSFASRVAEEPGPGEPAAARLVALLLGKLKRDAELRLGEPVSEAVITVPASATHRHHLALVAAAEQAGLSVLGTICGPTAAALAHGRRIGRDHRFAVVDLGARTLGVSLVTVAGRTVEVTATVGDAELGGADWDQLILRHITTAAIAEHGLDLTRDQPAMGQLADAAERAKIELSSAATATLDVPYLATRARGAVSLYTELSRTELERMAAGLLDRCAGVYNRAIRAGGDVDEVILVGGASRMPAIGALIRRLAGRQAPRVVTVPGLAAAGACLHAGTIAGHVDGVRLVDVARLPLAVQTRGGIAVPLVRAGTPLPATGSATFTTVRDGQESALFQLVQGESEIAASNTPLGSFELSGLGPAPRGTPRIDLTITADGTVRAAARDQQTRRSRSLTVSAATASAPALPASDATAVTLA